jgi:hypothetical protein
MSGLLRRVNNASQMRARDLPWYRSWIQYQVSAIQVAPQPIFQGLEDEEGWDAYFFPLWDAVHEHLVNSDLKTIDSITEDLIQRKLVDISKEYTARQLVKTLIFSIIGWQTMLYRPDISRAVEEFAILGEMGTHKGDAQLCLVQPASASQRVLPEFLQGFGIMFPPKNFCTSEDDDDQDAYAQVQKVGSANLDAYILTRLCGAKLEWVDCLSCHLELNKKTKTLYLYRYPGFCVSAIYARTERCSSLHHCTHHTSSHIQWANDCDVTEFLSEILLSYRLIFGQNKRSRKVFRAAKPLFGLPRAAQDPFLREICGRKRYECRIPIIDRSEYELRGDFSHLRTRVARLSTYASGMLPRTFWELWYDNRNSAAWLTFWTVLVLGIISTVLSLLQTLFQIMQYFQNSA